MSKRQSLGPGSVWYASPARNSLLVLKIYPRFPIDERNPPIIPPGGSNLEAVLVIQPARQHLSGAERCHFNSAGTDESPLLCEYNCEARVPFYVVGGDDRDRAG